MMAVVDGTFVLVTLPGNYDRHTEHRGILGHTGPATTLLCNTLFMVLGTIQCNPLYPFRNIFLYIRVN